MTNKYLKDIVEKIKKLEIQGASKVRDASLDAIIKKYEKKKKVSEKELKKDVDLLFSSRPTEPAMRNALMEVLYHFKMINTNNGKELAEIARKTLEKYKKKEEAVVKNAVRFFKKKAIFFTHCHSNLVEKVLVELNKIGVVEKVISTETRPLFQGRKTSRNLAKNGIKVIHIVDFASYSYLKDADFLLTGCDAILSYGYIINKIGTRLLSLAAKETLTEYFVITTSDKYDPLTKYGQEEIEKRDPKEIWEIKEKNIKIENPAFEKVPFRNIQGIISDYGITTPDIFVQLAEKEYRKYWWENEDEN